MVNPRKIEGASTVPVGETRSADGISLRRNEIRDSS
jgi:hypothetical protein